jgi:hypothetical protein
MGFVEVAAGSYSETCVNCDGGADEVSIKVEEAIDIKVEIPEVVTVSSIKTEHEVRL